MKERGGAWSVWLLLLPVFFACGDPEPPAEFREAFAALDKALATDRLESSAFAPRFPSPTARQLVSYLLSQAGAEVLQVSSSPFGEDVDMLSDVPVWPSSITLWHSSVQKYGKEKQVILTWDDARSTVTATAYTVDSSDPIYARTWNIVPLSPKVPLDPSDTREFQAF